MSDITKHTAYNEKRGYLLPINFSELDFEPKRMFVVNNVPPNSTRGNHAHHTTRQLLICTNGSVVVSLHDGDNLTKNTITKGQSIIVPKLVWDTQEFTSIESEIVVLCSTEYEEDDYINSMDDFFVSINRVNN